jgi:esterase
MGRRLAQAHPEWRFVLVDLRGHGDSHGFSDAHTVEACALDIRALTEEIGHTPEVMIGHSFGGKVALIYGRLRPPALKTIWSLDSPPGTDIVASAMSIERVIETARAAPTPFSHRLAAVPHFEAAGYQRAVAAWMTTNLKRGDGGFVWRFDLDIVQTLLEDYQKQSLWPFLEDLDRRVNVHFLLAGKSAWWRGPVEERLMALDRSFVHVLADAGHWVHMDDPDGLIEAISSAL